MHAAVGGATVTGAYDGRKLVGGAAPQIIIVSSSAAHHCDWL